MTLLMDQVAAFVADTNALRERHAALAAEIAGYQRARQNVLGRAKALGLSVRSLQTELPSLTGGRMAAGEVDGGSDGAAETLAENSIPPVEAEIQDTVDDAPPAGNGDLDIPLMPPLPPALDRRRRATGEKEGA